MVDVQNAVKLIEKVQELTGQEVLLSSGVAFRVAKNGKLAITDDL